MRQERVFAIRFASLYPLYVRKADSKNRSNVEVDQIICWLTGYSPEGLRHQLGSENDLETFSLKHHSSTEMPRLSRAWYAALERSSSTNCSAASAHGIQCVEMST